MVQGLGLCAFLIAGLTIRNWRTVATAERVDTPDFLSIRTDSFDDGKRVATISNWNDCRLEMAMPEGATTEEKAAADPSAPTTGVRDDNILAVASREPARHFL